MNTETKQAVKRQRIALNCHNGKGDEVIHEVDAYVYRGLAIHKSVGRGNNYSLTHLASGIALVFGITLRVSVLKEALKDSLFVHDRALRNEVFQRFYELHGR